MRLGLFSLPRHAALPVVAGATTSHLQTAATAEPNAQASQASELHTSVSGSSPLCTLPTGPLHHILLLVAAPHPCVDCTPRTCGFGPPTNLSACVTLELDVEQACAAMPLPSKAALLHDASSSLNGVTAKPDACHHCSCAVDQCSWCARRSAVRATCRCLRDAFDAVNPCLTLGGRKVLEFPTSWLRLDAVSHWAAPTPGLRAALLRQFSRSACLKHLTLHCNPWWLQLGDVLSAGDTSTTGRSEGLAEQLRSLTLTYRDDLTDADLSAVLPACTALRRLSLVHCDRIVSLGVLRCMDLTTLDLPSCTSLRCLQPLASLPRLEHLSLAGCAAVSDLSPLSHTTALCNLNCAHCTGITSIAPLHACTRLRWLSLRDCSSITDVSALAACPLELVDLRNCWDV